MQNVVQFIKKKLGGGWNGMEMFHLLQWIKYLFSETEAFHHIDAKSWKSSITKKAFLFTDFAILWTPEG